MFNPTQPSPNPIRDAFGGVFFGIVVAYFLIFSTEILTFDHHLDFAMLGNLLWLGVGVILFGAWEAWRAARA